VDFRTDLVSISQDTQAQSLPTPTKEEHLRVALVSMPWGSVRAPSLALGILKECVRKAGFDAEVFYLNIAFAKRLGLEIYDSIASNAFIEAEWFFSYNLFGPNGDRSMNNEWSEIAETGLGGSLIHTLLGQRSQEETVNLLNEIAQTQVPEFIDDCLETVPWSHFDLVGFSTTFAQSLASLLMAKRIKEVSPRTRIVFGGANVDSAMGNEFVRRFDWIDYVVHGEGERALAKLLHNLAQGNDVPIDGVSARISDTVALSSVSQPLSNLDESPIPDYTDYIDQLKRADFLGRFPLRLYFETSRGCWWGQKHHCTFCGLNGSTMAFRHKSVSRALGEIFFLADTYRCLNFFATDNIFSMTYFKEFLPRIEQASLDFGFFYEIKANLTRTQVKQLAAAGIRAVQPGIESLSSRLLKLMDKGTTAIQNIYLLKLCKEYSIVPSWNILTGFPGERAEDYMGLDEMFLTLIHLQPPGALSAINFERFSPYHSNPNRYGLNLKYADAYDLIYPSDAVSLEEIAYFFQDTSPRRSDPELEEHLHRARSVWRYWVQSNASTEHYCFYRRGPSHLIIHDRRPKSLTERSRPRQLVLSGNMAKIYEYCADIRSLRAICEYVHPSVPLADTIEEIRSMLDRLVSERLMLTEDDRYLALASRGGGSIA
jgi:ribosomal peptide maturation radical SAM protein 1